MSGWVALLRAVNVGGMKVLMEDLRALAEAEGFAGVRTYIASGNLVLSSELDEAAVRERLEGALERRYGKRVPVLVAVRRRWRMSRRAIRSRMLRATVWWRYSAMGRSRRTVFAAM